MYSSPPPIACPCSRMLSHAPQFPPPPLKGWSHEHGHGLGLEVGSKAELTMALSMIPLPASPAFNLICNGCKDAEYMELVSGAGSEAAVQRPAWCHWWYRAQCTET